MTALLDFPVASAPLPNVLAVRGESALVPGTSLRLPLSPDAARLPLDDRCVDCAGTGIMFDGGHRLATNALMSCICMGSFAAPAPAPRPRAVIPVTCDPA